MTRTLFGYKLLEPGDYHPSSGPITLTAEDVQDFVDCINIKASLGVPVGIKYTHMTGTHGVAVIPVGLCRKAWLVGDKAYGDLEIEMDAIYQGEVVSSVETIATGLEKKILQGSMEAYRNYTSKAYTGGRKFGLWVTAWAILPTGEQPAIPPRIAANEEEDQELILLTGNAPEGNSPDREGAEEMEIKEVSEKVVDLGSKVDALAERFSNFLEQVKASNQEGDESPEASVDLKAAEEAVEIILKTAFSQKPAGQREALVDYVNLGKTPAEKLERITALGVIVPDLKVPASGKLDNGEAAPEGDEAETRTPEEIEAAAVKADVLKAKAIMTEEGCDYKEAIRRVDAQNLLAAEEKKNK